MKRVTIFFLLILLSRIIIAQNAKLDSLTDLISKANSDTARIKLMISKVNILSHINLDSAINLALKTLEQTGRIHYYSGEVDLRVGLASNYSFKGNYKAASDQINYLKQYINTSKDSSDFGSVYSSSGLLYGMQSKYDSSIYYYENAIRIFEKAGDNKQLGSCYSNIAIGYQQKANFPMALFYYQRALKLSEARNDEIQQAISLVNIADIYNNMGDFARAESTYLKDIELAKRHMFKNVLLYVYTNLSTMYIDQENWQKSYEFAIQAAELGRETGDQGIEAASLSKAATALSNLNEPEKALATARKAITIADSSAQPLNILQACRT